jgi:hypothetical protein
MAENERRALVKPRRQVQEKLVEIRQYIDDQRGNDPQDDTGLKVLKEILLNLFRIEILPWSGRQVRGMSKNYRQRRVAESYLLYYYVNDPGTEVYLIDLRHVSQRPLKPSTLRKYKGEIED